MSAAKNISKPIEQIEIQLEVANIRVNLEWLREQIRGRGDLHTDFIMEKIIYRLRELEE